MIAAMQCENGLKYQPCIDACEERKCTEPGYGVDTCPVACVEGCGCEEDEELKDGKPNSNSN